MQTTVRHNLLLPRVTNDELPDDWERLGHSDGWAWYGDGQYVCRLNYVDQRHNDEYSDNLQGFLIELYAGGQSISGSDHTMLLSHDAAPIVDRPTKVARAAALGVAKGLMGEAGAIEQSWLEYGD
jgi:hypothetical protein